MAPSQGLYPDISTFTESPGSCGGQHACVKYVAAQDRGIIWIFRDIGFIISRTGEAESFCAYGLCCFLCTI